MCAGASDNCSDGCVGGTLTDYIGDDTCGAGSVVPGRGSAVVGGVMAEEGS